MPEKSFLRLVVVRFALCFISHRFSSLVGCHSNGTDEKTNPWV